VVLDERTDDSSLKGAFATHTFTVGGCEEWCRWVRVRSTGKDSRGSNYLVLCGLELYGRLREQ